MKTQTLIEDMREDGHVKTEGMLPPTKDNQGYQKGKEQGSVHLRRLQRSMALMVL